jgi:hypothetical protein
MKAKLFPTSEKKSNVLDFGTNWNNKLTCSVFTTLRLHNPKKYIEGNILNVRMRLMDIAPVKIISVKSCYGRDLTEGLCLIDTGYSKRETLIILENMYKSKAENLHLDIVFCKWLEVSPMALQGEFFRGLFSDKQTSFNKIQVAKVKQLMKDNGIIPDTPKGMFTCVYCCDLLPVGFKSGSSENCTLCDEKNKVN